MRIQPATVADARIGIAPPARRPVTRTVWDLLLASVAAYLLTAVGRWHQTFPVLDLLKPTLVASALAIALLLLDPAPARRLVPALRTRPVQFALAVLVWALLSVPGALHTGGAFEVAVNGLLRTVVMFLVLVCAVRDVEDVRRVAYVYFIAVAVYSAVILGRFEVGYAGWRLGKLYYYDANDFATLAVTALPLGLYFGVTPGSIVQRVSAAVGSMAILIAFVWAGSRGGFLALVAVLLYLVFRFTAVPVRWRALSFVVTTLLLAATASEAFWTKMGTMLNPSEDYNLSAEGGRVQIWTRGATYMLTHPVLGVGAGNFPNAEGTLSPLVRIRIFGRGLKWSAPHNTFVQAGAELGIPGLLFFIGMIISAFVAIRATERRLRAARAPPSLPQALFASLLAFVVGGFFLSLAYSDMLYTLIGLAAGLAKTVRGPA